MGDQHEFKICLHARHSDTSDYSYMENFDDIFPIFQNFEETIIVKKNVMELHSSFCMLF